MEEIVCRDRVVDFCLEDGEEAGFAEFLVVFGPEDQGAVYSAGGTERGCHFALDMPEGEEGGFVNEWVWSNFGAESHFPPLWLAPLRLDLSLVIYLWHAQRKLRRERKLRTKSKTNKHLRSNITTNTISI